MNDSKLQFKYSVDYNKIPIEKREELENLRSLSFPSFDQESYIGWDDYTYWVEIKVKDDRCNNDHKGDKYNNDYRDNRCNNDYRDNKGDKSTKANDSNNKDIKDKGKNDIKDNKTNNNGKDNGDEKNRINENETKTQVIAMLNIGYDNDLLLFTIQNFCVHPQFRERGIGTRLIKHAMNDWKLKDKTYNFISLWIEKYNKGMIPFYENLGFFIADPKIRRSKVSKYKKESIFMQYHF